MRKILDNVIYKSSKGKCPYCDRKITIIDNNQGKKFYDSAIKYCFYCGKKRKGEDK